MSIFLGSNAGETITPDFVSSSVGVVGNPKKPSSAADIIFAGGGNDVVAAGGGSDLVFLGSGDDTFIWNVGDGSDVVSGDGGFDTLKLNGASANESIELSSLLGAASVKVGNATSLVNSMERVEIASGGGEDTITINDLGKTDVREVAIDLGSDAAHDRILANGANARDVVEVSVENGIVKVDGLSTDLTIKNADATDKLIVRGNGGNDLLSAVNVAAGTVLFEFDGGTGNDVMHGSNGNDFFIGGAGDDFVDGNRGDDFADLGAGNDTFVWDPGDGSDVVEGGAGRDLMLFNGAGAAENVDIAANGGRTRFFRDVANITMDLNDVEHITFNALGGADNVVVHDLSGTDATEVNISLASTASPIAGDGAEDRVTVEGSGNADAIAVASSNGAIAVNGLAAKTNITAAEATDTLVIASGAGADTIDASGLAANLMQLQIQSGDGNDTITGSAGNDLIIGGRGDDTAFMGAGDDTFVWSPGEGSDVVEGGDGFDIMEFNGANGNENIDISANGERTRFFRDAGNITMDLNDVERATFNALRGEDTITVHALTGWDVREVEISLAGELLGSEGDDAVDTVIAEGGEDSTVMSIGGTLDLFSIDSGSAYIGVVGAETQDRVVIKGLGGDDMIIAHPFETGGIHLTIDGGAGDDFITGANGVETVLGGDGNDFVDGNEGNDMAFLGAGDDVFQWDPGDGSDVVEGGDGFDEMLFNGAGANETVEIAANGERARFFRQPGNITMDLNDVEKVTFNALGGTDDIVVRDLNGTDVQEVSISLASQFLGTTPDGQLDRVTVEATDDQDFIDVLGSSEAAAILGTPAFVSIERFDTTDTLTIKAGGGDDQISASTFQQSFMQLTIDGGDGDDTIFGSSNADTFIGGDGDDFVTGNRGDDTALLGAGDDFFIWNPGDGSDTVEGGDGIDFLGFRGAAVAENITIAADGERVKLVRDVANVTMDLDDVERMTLNTFGGTDNVTIGDLSGTDMEDIEISLLNSGLPNDGAQDSVSIAGSTEADAINVTTASLQTSIDGLRAHISISGADKGLDRLQIDAGGGNDLINAAALTADLFQFSVLGGDGNDAIVGSGGDDTIDAGADDDIVSGDEGDDIIDGGSGFDILLGGAGDDTFRNGEIIQDFVAGAGSEDRIDLRGLDLSFDWIVDHAADLDGGALLDFGGSQLLLADVTVASLHQDDFLLA